MACVVQSGKRPSATTEPLQRLQVCCKTLAAICVPSIHVPLLSSMSSIVHIHTFACACVFSYMRVSVCVTSSKMAARRPRGRGGARKSRFFARSWLISFCCTVSMTPSGVDVCASWLLVSGKCLSRCKQRSTIVSPANHVPWSSAVNHLPPHPLGLSRLRNGRPSTAINGQTPSSTQVQGKVWREACHFAYGRLRMAVNRFQAFGLDLPYVREDKVYRRIRKNVCACVRVLVTVVCVCVG